MRVIILLLWLAAGLGAQGGPPLVQIAPVAVRDVAERRGFVGAVAASRTSTVGSELAGYVATFRARAGMFVKAGDPLATLRSDRIEISLRSARAEQRLRESELLELKNGARKEELAQARARLVEAQAAVEIREWKVANARRLRASETISADALRDSELAARVAQATLAAVQASFDLVEAGPRLERIAQAQARLDVQLAVVAALEDDKKRHVIRAPFDGYVLHEDTEEGQWLDQGGAVAEIAALDEVDVIVPVLEDHVSGLRVGMKKIVNVDSLPGRTFDATLIAIVPRADARARTFPVKLRVKNPRVDGQPVLRVGMFARLDLAVGEKKPALLVPKDALVLGGPRPLVFVVDVEKKTAAPVTVELGLAVGDHVVVTSGISAGDHVVVRGNERLRPQPQPVRIMDK